MATIKAVSSKASLKRATDYISNKEKTKDELMCGINCNPDTARIEMETIQRGYEKTDGRTYKHYTLNYHKDDKITPEQCLQNARKLCEETKAFQGHQILIAVHTDKEHLHAHIIVGSVNMENGKKLQWSKADLRDMKNRSDEMCRQQGLKITQKGKTFEGKENGNTSTYTKEAYKSITDKNSWVVRTGLAVMECREKATDREDFIEKMKEKGYEVKWTDKRKNITFIDKEREQAGEKKCSIRDTKLEQHFHIDFGKESLQNEFARNAREQEKGTGAERTNTATGTEQRITTDDTAKRIRELRLDRDSGKDEVGEAISRNKDYLIERTVRENNEVLESHRQRTEDSERVKREAEAEQGKGRGAEPDGEQTEKNKYRTRHER